MVWLTWVTIAVTLAAATIGVMGLLLGWQARRRAPRPLPTPARRLLVVSPHPDDCVIIGAGQAMRTVETGGSVRILYATTGSRKSEVATRATRRREALEAWAHLDLGEGDLVFLEHEGESGLLEPADMAAAVAEIRDEIQAFQPDRVVMPLYEGGHAQHDAVNWITARALADSGVDADLYEAAEYNFYWSWHTTPEKMLALLSRLLPGWDHPHPPEPIDSRALWAPPLTAAQQEQKKSMLHCFATQSPEALVRSAGGPERLQRYRGHDYTRPPFRYAGSFAWCVDHLKRLPGLGAWFRKSFRRTRTLHPDPRVRMHALPIEAVERCLTRPDPLADQS